MKLITEVKGTWHELKGIIQQKWGKFTDNDLAVINGHREKLVGSLMTKFGLLEVAAEQEVAKFWPKS